jgi:hypothetical protein
MSSEHTCDVNVIYGFVMQDNNIRYTNQYLKDIKNSKFIYLNEVKNSFEHSFTNNLKEVCDAIISSINRSIEEINNRPKTARLTLAIEKSIFNSHLNDILKEKNLDNDSIGGYKELLLSKVDFTKIKSFEELEKFRDEAFQISEKLAVEALDKFRKKLKNFKKAPRLTNLQKAEWEQKINEAKTKYDLFNDVDNEDIFIISELLAYMDNRNKNIIFSSFDRNSIDSLKTFIEKESLDFMNPRNLRDYYKFK